MKTIRSLQISISTAVLALTCFAADAVTPISFTGTDYVENFDSLPSAGENPTFSGFGPFDVPSLAGWSFTKYTGNSSDALFRINNGSSPSGSLYNYGTTESPDRALGALASGSGSYRFGATLVNNTGAALTTFTLSYAGEQWRYGGSGEDQTPFAFEYALNAPDIGSGTYFSSTNLDLTPSVSAGPSGALDGNLAANRTAISGSTSGIFWQPGETLTLRWTDINNAGFDDGLGVDDLTFSAAAAAFDTLVWDQTGGNWNTTDANWTGDASVYDNGDLVRFTDSNVGAVVIDAGGVEPLRVQVENTTGTYSFTGGPLNGNGSLVKTGDGTLELGVSTELVAGIVVDGGTLATTASDVIGDTIALTINNGATVDLGENTDQLGSLTLSGSTLTTDGSAGVAVLGETVTVLADANTSTLSGILATNGISPTFTVANGDATTDLTIDAFIVGGDRISFDGEGTTALNADNSTFGGGFRISSGTIEIASNTSLGTGALFFNGGTLRASTELTGANAIAIDVSQGGDVTIDATVNAIDFTNFSSSFGSSNKALTILGNVTMLGAISNGGNEQQFASVLNKAGDGTLTLTQDNEYTGITTVRGGTLKLTDGAAISSSSSIRVDEGATFDLSEQTSTYVITRNEDVVQSLRGGGIVVAPTAGLEVNGDLSPGGTAESFFTQALTIQGGPVTFGAEATLTMELGGLSAGEFDQLFVTEGSLTLDGQLVLSLIGGFVPSGNDSFAIVTGQLGVNGAFTNAAFGERVAFDDGSFLLSLSGNDVLLSDFQAIPEPSTVVLILFGGLAVYFARRRLNLAK